jgi:hypothetical protein
MTPAWAGIAALLNGTDAEFHAVAAPLSRMTSLTYTATHGSYFNASTVRSTVDGWVRGLTADPPAGMRALLFYQPQTRRGVVAFRGTDLDRRAASGQADACADHILFNESGALPGFCAQFDAATIDYFARALEFVAHVRAGFPSLDLLFTGHSLGAGLAMMMSVVAPALSPGVFDSSKVKWPAVGFGTPAWLQPLRSRTGLSPVAAAARPLFAIADAYDPVEAVAVRDHGLLGAVCRWGMDDPTPAACGPCFAQLRGGGAGSAVACGACFLQRHIFSHYLADLRGPRPSCVVAAEAKLPDPRGAALRRQVARRRR